MIVLIYVQTIFHFQFCEWAAFVSLYYTFISGPLLRDLRLWLHSLIRLIFTSYNVLSIYTPCLKKTCQLLFALYLSTMNRFKWKLVGMFWNKHLIKQCINCPHHLKYMLPLPLEIWSDRSSRQRSTYMYILMNHWISSTTTDSYSFKNRQTGSKSHLF